MRSLTIYEIIAIILIIIVGLLFPIIMRKLMASEKKVSQETYDELDALYGGKEKMNAFLFILGFLPPVLMVFQAKIGWWIGLGFGLGVLLPCLMRLFQAMRAGSVSEFLEYLELKNNIKKSFITVFYSIFILIGVISAVMLMMIFSAN